jgi:Na+/melibiose symporter-like transporter
MSMPQTTDRTAARNLVVLFAGLFAVEGLCALTGLQRLPFDHYGKDVAGWSATHLASMHALLALPWAVKPIYGALSDNVPLFGSRRRSYLVLANALAATACLVLWLSFSQLSVMLCLFVLSVGMALSSAVAGGVLVESGQRYGNANLLVTQQWLWYGLANLGARLGGGALAGRLPGATALPTAALILVVPLLCVIVLTWKLTPEAPESAERRSLRTILGEMSALVRSRELLLVAAFLFCFSYNPGLQTPLYFHLTNGLGFTQNFIGTLQATAAGGSIVGVLVCRWLAKRLRLRTMFYICVALGVITALATFALVDHTLALVVYFATGVSAVFSLVMAATLAAEVCPGGQEGLCFAAMMSVENIASIASDASGSYMFDAFFHKQLAPLILVSAAFTAGSALLIWLLPERARGGAEAG